MISSLEEIACRQGFISREQLRSLAQAMGSNGYGSYFLRMAEENIL